jgi:hypothetical protein
MIEPIPGLPDNVLGLRASGKVTMEDYEQIFEPAIEKATAGGAKVRLLFQLTPEFEGYTAGAAFDDAKMGMKHFTSFERCAVVCDVDWINSAVKMFGFAIPCPIKVFPNAELGTARSWISEST